MERRRYDSGTPWESRVGYSRAVRVGPHIYVTGTTATGEGGEVVGVGDPYAQTAQALLNIQRALTALGATVEDVVRTRIYVTDMDQWEPVGRAHAEVFGHVRPATTLVEISRLIHPDMVVEIEADAFVTPD